MVVDKARALWRWVFDGRCRWGGILRNARTRALAGLDYSGCYAVCVNRAWVAYEPKPRVAIIKTSIGKIATAFVFQGFLALRTDWPLP